VKGAATRVAPADARSPLLAFACIAVWLVAAASASALGIWLAIGGAAISLGATIVLRDRATASALLRPSGKRVLLGAAAGCAMAAVTYLLYPVLVRSSPAIATDTALLYSAFRAPSPAIAATALLPIIVGEELVWRGAVQTAAVRRFGVVGGVATAALAYALAHAPLGSPLLVAVALLCGIAWSTLRATTASLVPPLVAHVVWDVLVLLWLPLDRG
jgi:uncharacterized protein